MSEHTPSDLRVTLVQTSLAWEDPDANIEMLSQKLFGLKGKTDLVVLPEMFTTGFSMRPEQLAKVSEAAAVKALKQWSSELNAVVCGSVMVAENGHSYNRFLWCNPDGSFLHYDKKHLFRMGEEQHHYAAGNRQLRIHYKGWNIAPFVCYDLRFPVWMRRTPAADYDLLLVVANWPERRSKHWKALAVARAIENQCYLAAVNRVGNDGNSIYHSGDSMLVSPMGDVEWTLEHAEALETITISHERLKEYRKIFPAGLDADPFVLK